jgi:hypothetical protein
MPIYDYKYLLDEDHAVTTADYSTNEVNFGVTNPNVGKSGMFGLHIVVTTTFTTLTEGMNITICNGAATTPTTVCASRFFAVGDLVKGKHYFIPAPPSLLQYARANFAVVSTAAGAGKLTAYFGEPGQGAE